jgi:hypothetical protein
MLHVIFEVRLPFAEVVVDINGRNIRPLRTFFQSGNPIRHWQYLFN